VISFVLPASAVVTLRDSGAVYKCTYYYYYYYNLYTYITTYLSSAAITSSVAIFTILPNMLLNRLFLATVKFCQHAFTVFTAELQNGMKNPMMKMPPSGHPRTPQTVAAVWMIFEVT